MRSYRRRREGGEEEEGGRREGEDGRVESGDDGWVPLSGL